MEAESLPAGESVMDTLVFPLFSDVLRTPVAALSFFHSPENDREDSAKRLALRAFFDVSEIRMYEARVFTPHMSVV